MNDLKKRLKSKIAEIEAKRLFIHSEYMRSELELFKECYEVICQMEEREDDLK